MSDEYMQEIQRLLDEAKAVFKEFHDLDVENEKDLIYKEYVFNGCLQWDLRRSQLEEKLADVKYGEK
jgi:hypothetical protein